MAKREFTIANEYHYNQSGPIRWIISHLMRYKLHLANFVGMTILWNVCTSAIPILAGLAFNEVLRPQPDRYRLLLIALVILGIVLLRWVIGIAGSISNQVSAQRLERDARDELCLSLLGKSQTFHNRQRVGDIMARASNDVNMLNLMMNPGIDLIFDSLVSLVITLLFIAFVHPALLLTPVLFSAVFFVSLRHYTRKLNPVAGQMREQFGIMNAGLTEAVVGIEVVKSAVQEEREKRAFEENARRYRDLYVRNGQIEARYLPTLLLALALVAAFLQGLFLLSHNQITLGDLVAYMGLMSLLSYPTSIATFTFVLVQLGIAGAERILELVKEETELDENTGGYRHEMKGEITFEHVTFGYGEEPVLKNVSFHARPGQTIAIVGQTGSGKSTLTKLVNRTYDVGEGRILIDGVDVREWDLEALRSQISTIEQDIFLFSRSIAENIAFGLPLHRDRRSIEQAAAYSQAHEFITHFKDGYDTVIGERGVTLSGGQRQRIAIARALLTDPHILILDDSTSAVDSATEDEIQRAIKHLLEGRTTLLITHRLSQIRQADLVLVIKQGQLIDQGSHVELVERCDTYRRIFARDDMALPEAMDGTAMPTVLPVNE